MDNLEQYKHSEFTLGTLVTTAKAILEGMTYRSLDGRVAPIPDVRTARYYQTMGVMKKPVRYEGRSAVYGYHQLLQLIVIKLLQAQGLSLAQIQNAMIQLSQKDLEDQLNAVMTDQHRARQSPPVGRDSASTDIPIFMGKMEDQVGAGCKETTEGWLSIYTKPENNVARDLIAAEVVPGVSVMIDPARVKDARKILASIRSILQQYLGDIE